MEGGMWGKIRGAVDPNYNWREFEREKAKEADGVVVEKMDNTAEVSNIENGENSPEAREVIEKAQEERLHLFDNVLFRHMRELANKNPKFAWLFSEAGNHAQVVGDIKMLLEGLFGEEIISGNKLKPLKRFFNIAAGTSFTVCLALGGKALLSGDIEGGGEAGIAYGFSSAFTYLGHGGNLELRKISEKFANIMSAVIEFLKVKEKETEEFVQDVSLQPLAKRLFIDEKRLEA